MTRLLLASASPARRATLRAAGIEPLVAVSSVDEPGVLAGAARHGPLSPADAVLVLARAKAEDVAATVGRDLVARDAAAPDGDRDLLVLGCDSMLELDGEVLGKPADAAEAVERWRAMRGRSGVLHTGHWLIDARPGTAAGTAGTAGAAGATGATGTAANDDPSARPVALGETASTSVWFADLSDDEVAAYVATGEPLKVAGAFTVDGLGGPFVERIEGDHHNVVGLSLPLLRRLLARRGVAVADLWTT